MNPDPQILLDTARSAAREAGSLLISEFGKLRPDQIGLKGKGDYVTDLDRRSEAAIKKRIQDAFPDHAILAEESGCDPAESEYVWIIDPLDGTANYVQSIPFFAVSIAVTQGGEVRAGVVYDPCRDEMFSALRGKGAFLNGKPVTVSQKQDIASAMLATGFPWRNRNYLEKYMPALETLIHRSSGMRRLGAAALDLAYTACARVDGFWEMKLKPWDIAAGVLLVREAGGVVMDFSGEGRFMESGNIVAGNRAIAGAMAKVTQEYLADIV